MFNYGSITQNSMSVLPQAEDALGLLSHLVLSVLNVNEVLYFHGTWATILWACFLLLIAVAHTKGPGMTRSSLMVWSKEFEHFFLKNNNNKDSRLNIVPLEYQMVLGMRAFKIISLHLSPTAIRCSFVYRCISLEELNIPLRTHRMVFIFIASS